MRSSPHTADGSPSAVRVRCPIKGRFFESFEEQVVVPSRAWLACVGALGAGPVGDGNQGWCASDNGHRW
jgi:hypothetical protein